MLRSKVEPVIEGTLHPDFTPLATALRAQLRAYAGGAAVCVYHRGECVADLWGGARDAAGRPWLRDTLAPSFSTTKGVASTLFHIMADRGLVSYEDRVARHWPEFAQQGKQDITVRHVLAHQSGLYHIRRMIDHAERMRDWEYMVRAIERTPPAHEPGARTGYHGLTYGFLVGEILQRVTGRRFPDLVRDELARPLGLDGLYVGAPPEALPKAAELLWPRRRLVPSDLFVAPENALWADILADAASLTSRALGAVGVRFDLESIWDALAPRGIRSFDFGAAETLRSVIPAANGIFTARSLARMYAALAGGGQVDGVRIMSAETVARAGEVQSAPGPRMVLPFDMRWRLGYHGVATSQGVPRHAFGHFGFGGSGAWADPSRDLAVALIVNSGMGTPFGDLRIMRIGGTALACARRRSRERAPARPRAPVLAWGGRALHQLRRAL